MSTRRSGAKAISPNPSSAGNEKAKTPENTPDLPPGEPPPREDYDPQCSPDSPVWKNMIKKWVTGYEKIFKSVYSPLLLKALIKENAPHIPVPTLDTTRSKEMRVGPAVGRNAKRCFTATTAIGECEPICELKGHLIMLYDETRLSEHVMKRPYPFVFFLQTQIANICIDARYKGNEARFIRKSCHPNAEIQNCVSGQQMHFFIVARKNIAEDEEITLQFDFKWEKAQFDVECSCQQTRRCEVAKFNRNRKKAALEQKQQREQAEREKMLQEQFEAEREAITTSKSQKSSPEPEKPLTKPTSKSNSRPQTPSIADPSKNEPRATRGSARISAAIQPADLADPPPTIGPVRLSRAARLANRQAAASPVENTQISPKSVREKSPGTASEKPKKEEKETVDVKTKPEKVQKPEAVVSPPTQEAPEEEKKLAQKPPPPKPKPPQNRQRPRRGKKAPRGKRKNEEEDETNIEDFGISNQFDEFKALVEKWREDHPLDIVQMPRAVGPLKPYKLKPYIPKINTDSEEKEKKPRSATLGQPLIFRSHNSSGSSSILKIPELEYAKNKMVRPSRKLPKKCWKDRLKVKNVDTGEWEWPAPNPDMKTSIPTKTLKQYNDEKQAIVKAAAAINLVQEVPKPTVSPSPIPEKRIKRGILKHSKSAAPSLSEPTTIIPATPPELVSSGPKKLTLADYKNMRKM